MEVFKKAKKQKGGGLYLTRSQTQPTVQMKNMITGAIIKVDFVGWYDNKKHGPQIRLKIDAPEEYRITRPERGSHAKKQE